MKQQLPPRPNLEQLRKQAKALLKGHHVADSEALKRIREVHPHWQHSVEADIAASRFTLADARHTIAHEYGFSGWTSLKAYVALHQPAPSDAETVAALREAAGQGDLPRLAALLDRHPELIDEPGGSGVRTALHQAVFGKSEAAVKLLLERGADPNIRCEGDNAYPLHFAVEQKLWPIIRLLVEHGADTVGEGDYHELGVMGWATAWDCVAADRELVNYLLAHGARHNLSSAVATGDVDTIRELAARTPADLERRMDMANRRRRPLHLAVIKKQKAALEALLDLGANMESLDEAGFTALDQAALDGDTEMVRILLDRGARVRLPAAFALHRTADIERLLRKDPNALKPGGRWCNLIVRASERATGEVVEALIQAGSDANVRDDSKTAIDSTSGFTPLHAAAWHGNLGAIEALMSHGANVTTREEKYHGTPAGWADYAGRREARDRILRGPVDIIEAVQYELFERAGTILGEDPGALEKRFRDYGLFPHGAEAWYTPLAYAAVRGKAEVVQFLLEHGANRDVKSPDGDSLGTIAAGLGHAEVAEILGNRRAANKSHDSAGSELS